MYDADDKPCLSLVSARTGEPLCGTVNGYSNLRCRGQQCRDAWAAYCAGKISGLKRNPQPCEVTDCDRVAIAQGMCNAHYTRWMNQDRPNLEQFKVLAEPVGANGRKTYWDQTAERLRNGEGQWAPVEGTNQGHVRANLLRRGDGFETMSRMQHDGSRQVFARWRNAA